MADTSTRKSRTERLQDDSVSRRSFLGAAAGAAAFAVVPSHVLGANGSAPSNKLNIAVIGVRGRGGANLNGVKSENIVALCDVDEKRLADAAKDFPKAETYVDWRKCVDQKNLDAVVCSTTDHTHAFVSTWAMNRGLHVYCEKPLARTVEEARTVRETYLKNRDKLATQMGTQIHASNNFRRMVELVRSGAIGTPQEAHVWCSRSPENGSYLPDKGPAPDHLNWDLWNGPTQYHPYNPGYVPGCLKWNKYWDFGAGQIGDMGSHMIDMAYWAFDLGLPTTCEAEGSPVHSDTCPTWLKAKWDHPANDWRPAIKLHWYDGGKKPKLPGPLDEKDLFKGALFKGDKGYLLADYGYRLLLPRGDMTQYESPDEDDLIPSSPGHHREWIIGCKTGKPTLCNFDYSGRLIENNLLSLVAYRTGDKLQWSANNLKAANCPEADKFVRETYRDGWVLNG